MRVILADDHRIVREGLRWMLASEEGVDVVGEAESGAELLDLLERVDADVILLDIRMPGMSGLEALERVRIRAPDARVMILSMYDEPTYVHRAVELGAVGYLRKDVSRAELIRALECVAQGKGYVQAELTGALMAQLTGTAGNDGGPSLTPRQQEVLRLLADGLENKQIASRFSISETTVETHIRVVFARLGVQNRAAAVAEALRRGLIE